MASLEKIIDQILDDIVEKLIERCFDSILDILNRDDPNSDEQVHDIKTIVDEITENKNNDILNDIIKIKSDAKQKIKNDYNSIIEGEVQCNIEQISKRFKKVTEEIEKVQDGINDFSKATNKIF